MKTHAVNWNNIQDPLDHEIWKRLTTNFWLPEKISLASDLPSWNSLDNRQRTLVVRIFAGLTLLDTIQAVYGVQSMIADAVTEHEAAVLTNISFMESVHAKSYSYIFSTLCSSQEIHAAFDWCYNHDILQDKASTVRKLYAGSDPLKKKVASTFLESLMFYSGFYVPLYLSSRNKLPNTADIIRLIIRDEAIHGYYIGYKFQVGLNQLCDGDRSEMIDFVYATLHTVFGLEVEYTRDLYDFEMQNDVIGFIKYNANKALNNLGFRQFYREAECAFDPAVLSALSPQSNENHDFFSGSGSSYVMGKAADIEDEDWAF